MNNHLYRARQFTGERIKNRNVHVLHLPDDQVISQYGASDEFLRVARHWKTAHVSEHEMGERNICVHVYIIIYMIVYVHTYMYLDINFVKTLMWLWI